MAVEDRPIHSKIHMMAGGSSGLVEPLEAKRPRLEDEGEDATAFIKRDAKDVLALYNDAMVVTANNYRF